MSQEFYARKILPKHIKEIKALEEHYHRRFRFQEDGDPSHDLLVLVHPAQSPDLNPIEAL
ncbi:hypothetical protein K402DRAFT_426060 [Aulographum hederae CBS 113979]|uniref:Uncharacterized protein n=1 Tax=Aulographum hederae CBS 113979 TaxID=1176131 RepID=A0A6G1GIA6_9PEZI|nr:hypothetical protein K402DRAFT_426060 [Aulographum hederae CBS 113979]